MNFKKDVYTWSRRQMRQEGKPLPMPQRLAMIGGLALVIVLIALNRTSAQDAPPTPGCGPTAMQEMQVSLDEQNKLVAAAAAAGDVEAWLELLRQSRLAFSIIDSLCRDMSYSSEVDGQQPVIGPLFFTDGVWKSTFTTDGMGQVIFEIISGDCDQLTTMLLYNGGFSGEFKTGAGNTFTTADTCQAMVKVGLADKPWTLNFEYISPTN